LFTLLEVENITLGESIGLVFGEGLLAAFQHGRWHHEGAHVGGREQSHGKMESKQD
jgi:hypothetical protein